MYVVEVGRAGGVGEPRLIPGAIEPHSISISADGRKLVYPRFSLRINVWSVPMPDQGVVSSAEWTPETLGRQTIEIFDVSPDGDSLLFDSNRSGNQDIYKSGRGDENPVQLTTDPANDYGPAWSPDGREVTFYSLRTGFREIFVMPAVPGGEPEQLTDHRADGHGARWPRWSPDGLTIVYSVRGRLWMIRRDSLPGQWGEPEPVTDFTCLVPDFSPSGEWISCFDGARHMVVDLAGNVVWDWPGAPGERLTQGRFKPDGDLSVLKELAGQGGTELWLVTPIPGSEPSLLLRERNLGTVWARFGGGRIYMNRPEYEGDLYVMDLEWEE